MCLLNSVFKSYVSASYAWLHTMYRALSHVYPMLVQRLWSLLRDTVFLYVGILEKALVMNESWNYLNRNKIPTAANCIWALSTEQGSLAYFPKMDNPVQRIIFAFILTTTSQGNVMVLTGRMGLYYISYRFSPSQDEKNRSKSPRQTDGGKNRISWVCST